MDDLLPPAASREGTRGADAAPPPSAERLSRWSRAVKTVNALDATDATDAIDVCALPSAASRSALARPLLQPPTMARTVPPAMPNAPEAANAAVADAVIDGAGGGMGDELSARALPLSALRGLHAGHRQSKAQAMLEADVHLPTLAAPAAGDGAAGAPANAATPAGLDSATAHAGQLQSLIESCCTRLWVSDSAGGHAQAVLLDLGRWMPGCTVEVAKAAGILRVTLRGLDADQQVHMAQELDSLGDAMAQRLGCRVVTAVNSQNTFK